MEFKIGDIVNTNGWNIDPTIPYIVDRVFKKKHGQKMLRLKNLNIQERTINVPEWTCKLDVPYLRNKKLNELGICG